MRMPPSGKLPAARETAKLQSPSDKSLGYSHRPLRGVALGARRAALPGVGLGVRRTSLRGVGLGTRRASLQGVALGVRRAPLRGVGLGARRTTPECRETQGGLRPQPDTARRIPSC